jgi:hypothetical protein
MPLHGVAEEPVLDCPALKATSHAKADQLASHELGGLHKGI